MKYNFDDLPDRKNSESIKWHYFDEDVLPMWVADMDFVSPEPVVRALRERVEHSVFGYAACVPGLQEAIIAWIAGRYQWEVKPEEIVFVPGVVTGAQMAVHAFAGNSGGLLIQPPIYMPFLRIAQNAGAVRQDALLSADPGGYYTVDDAVFEAAITEQTRMFLLCNPHNPVGRVFTRSELERMAEICLRHDLIICSDEIHSDLIYSGHRHTPIATLSEEVAARTVTLMAPSKTFNIAGLSCSFAIIPNPELRRRFEAGHMGLVHGVNLMGLVAAEAAYRAGQEWLDQLIPYLEANRDALCRFVADEMPGVKMFCPEGTYLAWLDCREAGITSYAGKYFLEKARVALVDGEAFGPGGEGFVRLNFGCPRGMLMEALERMKNALP